jgi:phosphate transport system substrate-binding protein
MRKSDGGTENVDMSFNCLKAITTTSCVLALCLATWAQAPGKSQLVGVGGTFPLPIYTQWFQQYQQLHPDWEVRYIAAGSGEGIRQLTSGAADFAGSDAPMSDDQLAMAKIKILHFPSVLGAVVAIYDLPEIGNAKLRLSPECLAGIFLGSIKNWNDPLIAADNPDVKLPAAEILVFRRDGASGTTYVWTDYLSKVSPRWKKQVGRAMEVSWPLGRAVVGSGAMAEKVQTTPYSVGYVELSYALMKKVSFALVENGARKFIRADATSIRAAADATVGAMPADFRVSLTDAPGKESYPIASFSWLLVRAKIEDEEKRTALKQLLDWILNSGQRITADSNLFVPIPEAVLEREKKTIAQMK